MDILGIDVGGTGIKGALVNTETGDLAGKRLRLATPPDFQPGGILETIAKIVHKLDYQGPVGVGFPAVVINGLVTTPPTALAYSGWDAYPVAARLAEAIGRPAVVVNDADAACLAEMRFGAGRDQNGVVMVFTFGTGIGSALFVDGTLVPNLEMGHLFLRGRKLNSEMLFSDRARKEEELSWQAWGELLNEYFNHVERLFSPRLIIIGGGVSKKHEKFLKYIQVRAEVVPAAFRNEAGIVGAAMAAQPLASGER
jgi:polyphosphate glucokinase